ncbi:hypothetical protein BS78_08G000500 [Paspalum vaginatum]|nr:hypothetical protein BS78_08G000500 [Paspalum vaginatum]
MVIGRNRLRPWQTGEAAIFSPGDCLDGEGRGHATGCCASACEAARTPSPHVSWPSSARSAGASRGSAAAVRACAFRSQRPTPRSMSATARSPRAPRSMSRLVPPRSPPRTTAPTPRRRTRAVRSSGRRRRGPSPSPSRRQQGSELQRRRRRRRAAWTWTGRPSSCWSASTPSGTRRRPRTAPTIGAWSSGGAAPPGRRPTCSTPARRAPRRSRRRGLSPPPATASPGRRGSGWSSPAPFWCTSSRPRKRCGRYASP